MGNFEKGSYFKSMSGALNTGSSGLGAFLFVIILFGQTIGKDLMPYAVLTGVVVFGILMLVLRELTWHK